MRTLLIGGPKFVGRAIIDAALAAGHELTMFNRGQTNPELYPQVEKLYGDRDGQLDALKGRTWDVVIDTSGYMPRIVRQSADLLTDSVGRYTFISTISVYQDTAQADEETSPLHQLEDESVEDITGGTYGGLKVLCERAVQDTYGERATIIRPGLIVGPYDPLDRFTYWTLRTARGGDMLAPHGPDYPMQLIDVRDLAAWTVHLAETGTAGIFNATGPAEPLTFGGMLAAAQVVAESDANFVWVSDDFLTRHEVAPWSEIPMWIPGAFWATVRISRALDAGLTFRPLAATTRDTLAWAQHELSFDSLQAGLKPEREAELLAAWRAAQQ
jgi:2'-hydroxyisoflavone reductase